MGDLAAKFQALFILEFSFHLHTLTKNQRFRRRGFPILFNASNEQKVLLNQREIQTLVEKWHIEKRKKILRKPHEFIRDNV